MPRYSEEIIEEIREKTDIVDLIQQYVPLKKKGASYFGLCPFHNEKTPSFSVSREKQMYYCFGCGAGGNVYTFLQNYENISFPEAVKELADRASVQLPREEYSYEEMARGRKRERMRALLKDAAIFYVNTLHSRDGADALMYFRKRELTDETILKFGLGASDRYGTNLYRYLKDKGYNDEELRESGLVTFSETRGFSDRFYNRAMFPIMNESGQVVGFGGRVMGDGEPKYLNSPETELFNKKKLLFGMNYARKSRRNYFILCEGYMDVITMHQAGFDCTVASLGTALTSENALVLKNKRRDIYLSYDSDGAGVKAALRAIRIFNHIGVKTKVINMRPYKDPDEFIKAEGASSYEKRIEEAENSFMYTIRMHENDFNLTDPEGMTEFERFMADSLLQFPEELERRNYAQALSEKYHIPFEGLLSLVRSEAAKGVRVEEEVEEKPAPVKTPQNKTDGLLESERMLLSIIAENKAVFKAVRPYLDIEDFSPGLHRELAGQIFDSMDQGRKPDVAAVMDRYPSADDQKEIASVFHSEEKNNVRSNLSRSVRETLIRVKNASFERKNNAMDKTSAGSFEEIKKQKKIMGQLLKLKFDF